MVALLDNHMVDQGYEVFRGLALQQLPLTALAWVCDASEQPLHLIASLSAFVCVAALPSQNHPIL
jgi:hypothetical protein